LNKLLFSQINLQQSLKKITFFLNFPFHSFSLTKFKKQLRDFWSQFIFVMFKKTLWLKAFFPFMFLLGPIFAITLRKINNFSFLNYLSFFFGFLFKSEFFFFLDFSKIQNFSLIKSFERFLYFFKNKPNSCFYFNV